MKYVLIGMLFLMGCTAPVAKRYYASCVEAGTPEYECAAKANEINSKAWQNLGTALQQASPKNQTQTCIAADHGQHTVINCY